LLHAFKAACAAFDRRVQRRVVLGEAQARQALARRRRFVERRQRDRGHAVFGREPAAEREIVEVADRRVIDELEVPARHRQRLQARLAQLRGEVVALGLVERAELS
jgi:acetyl-CoA carboxylase carboxyltransferase component